MKCQSAHWKEHKQTCFNPLQTADDSDSAKRLQLVLNWYRKSKPVFAGASFLAFDLINNPQRQSSYILLRPVNYYFNCAFQRRMCSWCNSLSSRVACKRQSRKSSCVWGLQCCTPSTLREPWWSHTLKEVSSWPKEQASMTSSTCMWKGKMVSSEILFSLRKPTTSHQSLNQCL